MLPKFIQVNQENEQKMKIVFRISKMGFGGAERVFLSVAKELKRHYGCTPIFVVDELGVGVTEHKLEELGIELYGLGSKRTLSTILPFKRLLDNLKPDVVISAYTDTNVAAIISSRLCESKPLIVVSEHASLSEHWKNSSFFRKLVLKIYVVFAYRLAHHILTVSKGIAQQIIGYGHASCKVSNIYNPVRFKVNHIKEKPPTSTKNMVRLLAVGRITPQKDYMTLMKAFELLQSRYELELTVVGGVHNKKEKEDIDQFLAQKSIKNKITFVDFTEDVGSYYESSDLFVLSSAWEGFGNVIVEALAYGLPVVSTDCNHGPAEILENGRYGRLVPVGDFKAMADAISGIIEYNPFNPVDQIHRSNAFGEEKIAQQYFDLIKSIS